jgi:regulator of sirC expression with transglutaminase-like and TPR domain
MHYESWCALTEEQLAERDIAEINLAAGFGLPNAGELDVRGLCRQVDDWAEAVDHKVRKSLKRRARGEYAEYTVNQFRMLVLVTVLQRDFGLRYNLAFSEGEYDARDSRNLFIHGILQGHGGTCVTMPVLYIAVARRLGWPLFLAKAKEHLFCRWEDSYGERFNIEANSPGFVSHPDERYHRLPKRLSERELASGLFLRPLTRREELAAFLSERGHCFMDNMQSSQALQAFYYASNVAPHDYMHEQNWMIATISDRMLRTIQENESKPKPGRSITIPPPRHTGEQRTYPIAMECVNRILRLYQGQPLPVP